jgi:hypothetical protein
VSEHLKRSWNLCRTGCAGLLRNLWWLPQLQLRPVASRLELPLRPSPWLRNARWMLRAAILLYAVELLLGHHWLAALLVALSAASGLWRGSSSQLRGLLLAADGRLFLSVHCGGTEEVWLRPESLRIGAHLLLVLRGRHRTCRLLLGPDNLAADELAALKRRLPPEASRPTGVHSVAAPGSKSSDPP